MTTDHLMRAVYPPMRGSFRTYIGKQTITRRKRVDGYIRQRIFQAFDSAGELAMNDAMTAADVREEERKEAHDFVEMGSVSEETKGSILGNWYDGALGNWG